MSSAPAPSAKPRAWVRLLIVFVIAFDVAALFQWMDGAFQSEFGGHQDEAAHYLAGVRVRDAVIHEWTRVRSGGEISVRQPAAALRRTNAFDAAQGGWMLAFGTSRIAVLLFMATLAAATTTMVFGITRRECGDWAAVVASSLWLCAPAVRESYETILPGLAGALVFTGAVLLWARLMDEAKPLLAASGRWVGIGFALGGACVIGLAIAASLNLSSGGANAASSFLRECVSVLGIACAVFALAGAVIRPRPGSRTSSVWVALTALVASALFARWMNLDDPDARILIVATPALAMLAVRGAIALAGTVGAKGAIASGQARGEALWLFLLLLLAVPADVLHRRQKEWEGFGAIAQALIEESHGATRVLVASDPRGEGMLISEVAMNDAARHITVERGSETLVESVSPPPGRRPQERFLEDEQLLAHLTSGRIRYIVLDSAVPMDARAGYHDQILRVLESNVRSFWPIYDSPVTRDGEPMGHPLRIFRVMGSERVELR